MDTTTKVTPYTQFRRTKLGLALVTITPEGDLWNARVIISYKDSQFRAEGIFSTESEAFFWSYGIKQNRNDRYAGYMVEDDKLIESKVAKNKSPEIVSIQDALFESQLSYDSFSLSKSSTASDKVSMAAVNSSPLLSDEDKIVMVELFRKMGKGVS